MATPTRRMCEKSHDSQQAILLNYSFKLPDDMAYVPLTAVMETHSAHTLTSNA